MSRKAFMDAFPGNECDLKWSAKQIKAGVSKLKGVKDEVVRAQKRIVSISEAAGLTVADLKDLNRRLFIGEAKARRAKKDMVEANLGLVI